MTESRNGSKLGTVDRLLGNKNQSKHGTPLQPTLRTLRRPASSSKLRRRHTTDAQPNYAVMNAKILGKHSSGNGSDSKLRLDLDELNEETGVSRTASSRHADGSDTDAIACRLALKHRLMLSEVKHIIREFASLKQKEGGGVEREDFDRAMARIFDVPRVEPRVAAAAYKAVGAATEIDIQKFLEWYVQNMFTQVNALNAAPERAASDSLVYQLAKQYRVDAVVIDKVKSKFDQFDKDRSGHICFNEFHDMFCSILKSKEVNNVRLNRFWSEILKKDPKGIDFAEFTEWYLKYFNTDAEDFVGIHEAFYDSFDPTLQRRTSLRGLSRIASMPSTLLPQQD